MASTVTYFGIGILTMIERLSVTSGTSRWYVEHIRIDLLGDSPGGRQDRQAYPQLRSKIFSTMELYALKVTCTAFFYSGGTEVMQGNDVSPRGHNSDTTRAP